MDPKEPFVVVIIVVVVVVVVFCYGGKGTIRSGTPTGTRSGTTSTSYNNTFLWWIDM